MEKGKIIYLEGVSSSGKTTLSKTLQDRLSEPYFWISCDTMNTMVPEKFFKIDFEKMAKKRDASVCHTIKTHSDLGIDVIIDFIPLGEGLKTLFQAISEYPVIYVLVNCPVEEIQRREKERGDRPIGLAASQFAGLAPQDAYDVTVDTYNNSSEECADKIIELLNAPEKFTAAKWKRRITV